MWHGAIRRRRMESWFYDAVKMICTRGMCLREATTWPKAHGEVGQQNGANVMGMYSHLWLWKTQGK